MADEAHKEPTMEEILSSIRKIISEDDVKPQDTTSDDTLTASDIIVDEADNDDFDDLTVEEVLEDVSADIDLPDAEPDDIFEIDADGADDGEDSWEPAETVAEIAEPEAEPEPAPIAAAAPVIEDTAPEQVANEIESIIQREVETEMAASQKYQDTVLTNESTEAAAAGALGSLISKMDMGGDNTIEGLVREMLKPMIKDWLDTNLPGIVEDKVEAEVQRIARLAR